MTTADAEAALAFHQSFRTDYIWPRDKLFFTELIEKEALYVAFDGEEMVAQCYMAKPKHREPNTPREFGGVLCKPTHSGTGIAAATARVALIADIVLDEPAQDEATMAHVHESNSDPLPLLLKLGFVETHVELFKDAPSIPKTLPRIDGRIPARYLELDYSRLDVLAKWLEQPGPLKASGGRALEIALPAFQFVATLASDLRDLATTLPRLPKVQDPIPRVLRDGP